MTEKECKPDYRGLKRATLIGRHASGAAITEHALQFRPENAPEEIESADKERIVFSDEQLSAVITFHNELPSKLSDPEWPDETKSAYNALCDELGVPIDARDELWEQALSKAQESNVEGE